MKKGRPKGRVYQSEGKWDCAAKGAVKTFTKLKSALTYLIHINNLGGATHLIEQAENTQSIS